MSNEPVEILVIEDNPGDVRLLQETLNETGEADYAVVAADRISTGLSQMERHRPDVILLDLGLPDSQGIDSLTRILAHANGIPIVVLTGLDDESLGSSAVKLGAQDYIIKGQATGRVLKRVITYAIERSKAEEKFRSIFDATSDGILITDITGKKFLDGNKAICRMLGYTLEEIRNLGVHDIHPENELASTLQDFNSLSARGNPLSLDVPMKRKDGSVFYADINPAEIAIAGITYRLGVFRDATQRKQAEQALQESEKLYRSLFENMLNGFAYCKMIFEKDEPADFIYLSVNHSFETLTGLKNVVGKKVSEVIPGIQKSDPQIFEIYSRVALTGVPETFETYLNALDMWFAVSVYSPSKEYFVAVFDVITERKKAEEKLRIAEQNFRNSLDESPLGIRVITEHGELLYANKAILDIFGFTSVEELEATPTIELYTPASYVEHLERRELRRQGKLVPSAYEVGIVRKDREVRRLSVSRKELTWNGNIRYQAIYQDITERTRAEALLSLSEKRFRNLVENLPLGVSSTSPDGRTIMVNRAFLQMHGYDSVEDQALSASTRYHDPKERERWLALIEEKGRVDGFEVRLKRKDGSVFWGSSTSIPIITDSGEHQIITVTQNITERKQAEETLRLQAELLDLESDSVDLHDFDGNILFANQAFYSTLGYTKEELPNMNITQFDDIESARLIPARLKELSEKGKASFNVNHLHKNGTWLLMEVHASMIELGGRKLIISVAHDTSERRKLEEQLMAQDRLASIGQLVSGVAHEINNPLTSVIGFADMLLQRELPDDVKADLKIINDEALRTSRIVKNLLTFARKQPEGKTEIQINETLERVLAVRNHEQKVNNIKVNTNLASDLPLVIGNSAQLQQVFFNIIVNAEQAMVEAHKGGVMAIVTQLAGDLVKISISDDGPGISPENMNRLFTPFFTTKGVGKGTGLGLSICHGIISEHQGRIYAENRPEGGVTFVIELPGSPKT